MKRFTSGMLTDDDGTRWMLINSQYYNIQDDKTCFLMSSAYHRIDLNTEIDDYEEKFCKVVFKENSSSFNVEWFDVYEEGLLECRLYKVRYKEEV